MALTPESEKEQRMIVKRMCKEQIKKNINALQVVFFRLGNDPLQLKRRSMRVEKRKVNVLDVQRKHIHPSHIIPTKIYGDT